MSCSSYTLLHVPRQRRSMGYQGRTAILPPQKSWDARHHPYHP